MKKRISIYICVMMLAFSFAGCTSEQSEKKPEIELQQIKSIGEFAVLECYNLLFSCIHPYHHPKV